MTALGMRTADGTLVALAVNPPTAPGQVVLLLQEGEAALTATLTAVEWGRLVDWGDLAFAASSASNSGAPTPT